MATIMTKRANTKRPMIMIRRNGAGGPAAPLRSRQAAAPGSWFNQYGSFCCKFAADAAIGNNRYNSEL